MSELSKSVLFGGAMMVLVGGCAHRDAKYETLAKERSQRLAAFETGCSIEEVDPILLSQGKAPVVRWYTVGTRGCGERRLYDVLCAGQRCSVEGTTSVATASTSVTRPER